MSNYLFTLTITPVQSFISQARKTKDLFVGSEILSSLSRKALKEFEKHGIKIIPQDDKFVSNKFVGKLENTTEKEVRDLGKKLEQDINKEFINKIFQNTNMCENNLQNFFKVFWVAVELEDDYKKSYKKLEQNLEAVKNLRTFKQDPQTAGKAKCVLCGERNQAKEDNGDKLCLICLTKRECDIEGKSKGDYPSTAKIALLDWLKDVYYDELEELKDENGEKFDEQWFLENDKQEIKDFIKKNKLDTSTQKKYYALIQFDIDDMGKTLSSLDEEEQKELSNALGKFTQKAKNILNLQYKDTKCTIYAGGDDFLGFVNLAYLFEILKKIKEAFKIENMTFSTSIVIAHYKAPLHKVLDFSRELLVETKAHFEDKNGVGIVVLSDSAINAKTICRYDNLELLKDMQEQKIGMGLHYRLQTIFNYLDNISFDEFLTQKEMIKVEIKRLLKREDVDFDEKIYNSLIAFFNNQKIEHSTNSYEIDFKNFIGYLKTLEQLRKVM